MIFNKLTKPKKKSYRVVLYHAFDDVSVYYSENLVQGNKHIPHHTADTYLQRNPLPVVILSH